MSEYCRGTDNCKCRLSKENLEKASGATGMALLTVVCPVAECKHGYHSHPSHDVAVAAAKSSSSSSSSSSSGNLPPRYGIGCTGGPDGKCKDGCVVYYQSSDSEEDLCRCGHTYNHHLLPASFVKPPPPAATRLYTGDSFTQKVCKREYNVDAFRKVPIEKKRCQICERCTDKQHASRFVDRSLEDSHFHPKRSFLYCSGNEIKAEDAFPVSINDAENGFLLCFDCHKNFDAKERKVRVSGDGTILIGDSMARVEPWKSLKGKKVSWHAKINTRNYPSTGFLNWANTLPKQGEEEKDDDDDDGDDDEEEEEEEEDSDEEVLEDDLERGKPPKWRRITRNIKQTKGKRRR